MKIEEKINLLTVVYKDVICNKCGKSCLNSEFKYVDAISNYNMISASICGNLRSKFLTDGIEYAFELCESCTNEIMESFKIPADKWEYI